LLSELLPVSQLKALSTKPATRPTSTNWAKCKLTPV